MKTPGKPNLHSRCRRLRQWTRGLALGFLLNLALAPRVAMAQATSNPPERLAYQGFVTDGTGVALATGSPKNYDIVFRIWNDPSAGAANNRLWSEQQTVTVDNGYFSVLLGEGAQYSGEARPNLSSVFSGTDASDRYMEFTVKGIGSGGSDVTILPRLRLLSSPYAFLAKSAGKLISGTGADLVTTSGGVVTVNGPVTASAFNGSLNGANLVAGSVTSAQIANGAVTSAQIANGAVTSAQIANSAVTSAQIANGTIGSAQIANGAVTSAQIANGAVGSAQIANGAVGSAQIADGSIVGADIASNLALWDNAGGNISYSAGNVSVGTGAAPKNLAVTGSLNVSGSITLGSGANQTTLRAPLIIKSQTVNDQSKWDIKEVDVSAWANSPSGFKFVTYEQLETGAPFWVRTVTGSIVFEQPGYSRDNTDFPGVQIRYSISANGGYGIGSYRLGDPAQTGYNLIFNENADWFRIYDFYPGNLIGQPNNKLSPPQYKFWFAFHPNVSGYVVISDN